MWNVAVRDSDGHTVMIGSELSYEEAMEMEREFSKPDNLVIIFQDVD